MFNKILLFFFLAGSSFGASAYNPAPLPYGPGNPIPASSLPVTGLIFYLNADSSAASQGTSITTIPDLSGNSNVVTMNQAATFVNPVLQNPYATHNCYRFINANPWSGIDSQCLFPNSMSVTQNNLSFYVLSMLNTVGTGYFVDFGAGYNFSHAAYDFSDGGSFAYQATVDYATTGNNFVASKMPMPQRFCLNGYSESPTDINFRMNRTFQDYQGSFPSTVLSGGSFMSLADLDGFGMDADIYLAFAFNHPLSDQEYNSLLTYLSQFYPIDQTEGSTQAFLLGDSIFAGWLINGKTWAECLAEQITNKPRVTCFGYGGADCATIQSRFTTYVSQTVSPNFSNVAFVEGGINDLVGDHDNTTTAYANYQQLCATVRGKGFYTVGFTLVSKSAGTTGTAFNTAVTSATNGLTATGCADYVVDAAADTRVTFVDASTHPNLASVLLLGGDTSYQFNQKLPITRSTFSKTITLTGSTPITINSYIPYGMTAPTADFVRSAAGGTIGVVYCACSAGSTQTVVTSISTDTSTGTVFWKDNH